MNFLSPSKRRLAPYVPGEQPQDRHYIKLNTNESPFPPAPGVTEALHSFDAADLRLYPDPDVAALRHAIAEVHGLSDAQVFVGGGSDEILGFAFMAFFEPGDPVVYADITYGFYKVYADLCGLRSHILPLADDFSCTPDAYFDAPGHMVIANPNAPTGMALDVKQVESIVARNPDRLLILDEAYIDYAEVSDAKPLLERYENLLIVRTYSKSYSMAGMRLGCAFGHPDLIDALKRIKFSFNPYNLDRVSLLTGIAATRDQAHMRRNVAAVCELREQTSEALRELSFTVLPSQTNFLFARHPEYHGRQLLQLLREQGILVRQFDSLPRVRDFLRITIGTKSDMEQLTAALKKITLS